MGTTTDKLNAVLDSKEAIRQAIEYRGVDIPMDTTLAEYADKIGEIPTGGTLTDEQALVFIGECAEGKRKIAKAVRNKYETITEQESGITEYSTFEELSNKISDIPIEVPLGSAMEQNGGILPFYDVYNELVKASKTYTEYPYCCAMELHKWDYDNNHKVTLSGADAYYTSDGVYLRSSEVNGEYQFTDIDQPNSNRFVIYFFGSSPYQVPKSLPATSVFGLWCLKGTPLMNFNGDYTAMNSVNVYDGELEVKGVNDFKFYNISMCQKLRLSHIKSINDGTYIFSNNSALREGTLTKLTTISGGSYIFNGNNLRKLILPNLTTISGGNYIFTSNSMLRELALPNLTTISGGSYIFTGNTVLREILMPNLKVISTEGMVFNISNTLNKLDLSSLEESMGTAYSLFAYTTLDELHLPKLHKCNSLYSYLTTKIPTIHLGDGMRDGVAGDIKIQMSGTQTILTTLTVAKGFKAKLNLTGCNGLSREVLVDILNNLADLTDTEYADKLQLILGATLYNKLTAEDVLIATNKHWLVS